VVLKEEVPVDLAHQLILDHLEVKQLHLLEVDLPEADHLEVKHLDPDHLADLRNQVHEVVHQKMIGKSKNMLKYNIN